MPRRREHSSTGPEALEKILGEVALPGGQKIPQITPGSRKILDAAQRIAQGEIGERNLGFTTRILVQANLPHTNPGNVPVWGRNNGNFSLTLQPGYKISETGEYDCFGYPYGVIPRLVMIYLCTYAVQNKTRHIDLGHSMAGFFKVTGIGEATGGRWGTISRFKNQVERLLNCHITFRAEAEAGGEEGELKKDGGISDKHMLWWNPKEPDQPTLFGSSIDLKQEFFQEIMEHPVPLNMDAVMALKKSPLAIDLYTWLNHRVSYMNKPSRIPWVALQKQMGSGYSDTKNFKKGTKAALRKIYALWPGLKIEEVRGGFRLHPCSPQIQRTKFL